MEITMSFSDKLAIAALLISILSVVVAIVIPYFQFFRKVEKLEGILYQFMPCQPNGEQFISVHIGFANNGNGNAIVSEVHLSFPMIESGGHKYNRLFSGIEFNENKPFDPIKVSPNELIEKKLAFHFDPDIFNEADFMDKEMGFLKVNLSFQVINREGDRIQVDSAPIFLTIKDHKVIGCGQSGVQPKLTLLNN